MSDGKLILLDADSLLFRAYYALSGSGLTDGKGRPTGAVYGFAAMLAKLIGDERPTHMAAAFDLRAPTFRHEMYSGYKAGRKATPEDLVPQIDMARELLRAFGVRILEKEGYEADDLIGTASARSDIPTLIVTGDRDSFQLIDETTSVLYTRRGISDTVRYDLGRLAEDGFTPAGVIEFKAVRGDPSDNIPGIPGVGEKTAMALLAEYGDLEGILSHADAIAGKIGERVRAGAETARLSRKLAEIDTAVPAEFTVEDMRFAYPLGPEAREALRGLEFSSLIRRFEFADSPENGVERAEKTVETVILDGVDAIRAAVKAAADGPVALDLSDGVRFAFDPSREYVAKISADLFGGLSEEDVLRGLRPVLENGAAVISTDYKKLLHALDGTGIGVNGEVSDVFLMSYLVNGGRACPDIGTLNASFGGGTASVSGLFSVLPVLRERMREEGLDRLYDEMELPLVPVLFRMEREGIRTDRTVLEERGREYARELEELTKAIHEHAGEAFNVNSPKQLARVLFDRLGLKPRKRTKTGDSADIDVLMKLYDRHPIVPLVVRYRTLSKLLSTYVQGLVKTIGPDGRIHTEYRQTEARTGRLSSTEPNLQNIPARTAEGREIRKAFAAGEGKVLISADYSQIELRLMAHLSGDAGLIGAYGESRDVHAATASEIYGVPIQSVTPEMRREAKVVNFGIIYGMSGFGLSESLDIGRKEAKAYIDRYFETYPGVKACLDGYARTAAETGRVRTMYGRIRAVPELMSPNAAVRNAGRRAAVNFPLQGSAADIIKLAMIRTDAALRGTSGRLILQVHDELIAEADERDADEVERILTDCMENVVRLSVPLTVSVSRGKTWYDV